MHACRRTLWPAIRIQTGSAESALPCKRCTTLFHSENVIISCLSLTPFATRLFKWWPGTPPPTQRYRSTWVIQLLSPSLASIEMLASCALQAIFRSILSVSASVLQWRSLTACHCLQPNRRRNLWRTRLTAAAVSQLNLIKHRALQDFLRPPWKVTST